MIPIDEAPLLLTPAETAKRLRVSPVTLRLWADKGLLRVHATAGGHRRYPLSEVERLLRGPGAAGDSGLRIMIVDDDPIIVDILRDFLLNESGVAAVEIAHDGFEAGRKLLAFKPDAILLDLMMPGLDGFDVCRRIKNDPATAATRIIAVSGQASEKNMRRIIAEGAEACLPKPVDHDLLRASLLRVGTATRNHYQAA